MAKSKETQKKASGRIPDLFAVSLAVAERHWLRWLADHEPFTGQKAIDAEHITLAIRELQLNVGLDGHAASATNLEQRIAAFKKKYFTAD